VSFRAEAIHVLAFRVYVERKDWSSALRLAKEGRALGDLNKEWSERFSWYVGLYALLNGNTAEAHQLWREFFEVTNTDSYKQRLLFWLSRTAMQMGKNEQSKVYYDQLVQDYPLSFYAVVAPAIANISEGSDWQRIFLNPAHLRREFQNRQDFGLKDLRDKPDWERLLSRAEMLLGAGH
jgi:hypothetical protein